MEKLQNRGCFRPHESWPLIHTVIHRMLWCSFILLRVGCEVEVGACSPSEQEWGAEPQPWSGQIKLKKVVLQLVPSDDNGGSGVGPSVDKSKAQYVVTDIHHWVRSEDPPEHALVLQNKVDAWNRWTYPCAVNVLWAETHIEWCHCCHSGDVYGGCCADEGLSEDLVYGSLHDSVWIDGADLCPADAFAVDGQQRCVQWDSLFVDPDGLYSNEVFGRGFALGVSGCGADGVDVQWRVDEGLRGVDVGEQPVRAVAEEHHAIGGGWRRETCSEFPMETESRSELWRKRNPGAAKSGHAHGTTGEAFQEEGRRTGEEELRHRNNPTRVWSIGGLNRNNIFSKLTTGGSASHRVVWQDSTCVVVASRPRGGEAIPTAISPG